MNDLERAGLSTVRLGKNHLHFDRLDSTNNYLRTHADELADGTLVTADEQFAGRGRQGRGWVSAPGQAVCMSVLLRVSVRMPLTWLPLAVGLAVAEALEALSGEACAVKWPNDVVMNHKKICGILCESVIQGAVRSAVCGMGTNVAQPRDFFAQSGLDHATSILAESGRLIPPQAVICRILEAFEPLADQLDAGETDAIREAYCARCITLGREVRVIMGDAERKGAAVGIDPDGALLCQIGDAVRAIHSGEASVRGLYGYV